MNHRIHSPLVLLAPLFTLCAALTACGGGADDSAVAPSVASVAEADDSSVAAAGDNTVEALSHDDARAEAEGTSPQELMIAAQLAQPDEQDSAFIASQSALDFETSEDAGVPSDEHAQALGLRDLGRGESFATANAGTGSNATSLATGNSCSIVPPIPAPPSGAKRVTDFGAIPNDSTDDTAAIQSALNSLKTGEWLVFPAGKYLHNNVIRLRAAGTTLYGKGATLHATNPDAMSLMISADNTAVYSFTLTAVTRQRQSQPWTSRIAIFKDDTTGKKLYTNNVTIQGNNITYSGAPNTPEANSSSAAGILIYKTNGFLVAQNGVARTLADGIHVTGASHDGRIMNNKVRETGDDMISVVSYAQPAPAALQTAAALVANWQGTKDWNLSRDVLISGNDVAGNYWGRGITVVGGEDVTIRGNKISSVAGAAGILLAREHNYRTFGVNNVLVEKNTIEKIQSVKPVYNPGNKFTSITKQGSIEVNSFVFEDEWADPFLREQLSVRNIVSRQNTIRDSIVGGLRSGTQLAGALSAVDPQTGKTIYRTYRIGDIKNLTADTNNMSAVKYGLSFISPSNNNHLTHCLGNKLNGLNADQPLCVGAISAVTGGTPSCTSSGKPGAPV